MSYCHTLYVAHTVERETVYGCEQNVLLRDSTVVEHSMGPEEVVLRASWTYSAALTGVLQVVLVGR